MLGSNIPIKMTLPWGNSAGSGFIRQVPTPSQIGIQNGAASFTDGFPPLTFQAIVAGGVPPFGQDFNGIFNQLSAWSRWYQAGGPVVFDATFSAAIGGYPSGSVIQSAIEPGLFWFSQIDNNTSNPDTGGANWIPAGSAGPSARNGRIVTSSSTLTMTTFDFAIGFNRTSGVTATTVNVPLGTVVNQEFMIQDLVGNFNAFPVTVTSAGGIMSFAGLTAVVLNRDRQTATFHYYGSNLWGIQI